MLNIRNVRFYFLVLFFLVANGLRLGLSSNQENYFALAKAAWDPSWMKGSFLFSEHEGTRILFNRIVGPLTEVMSFEVISITLTIFSFALMAFPLMKIWQTLHDDMTFTGPWLQIIALGSMGGGAFYGGEWFVGNFEPKVMAYICFWWALWALFIGKTGWVIALSIFATYWHVLVGGQTFIFLWTLHLWQQRKWKSSFVVGAAYSVCVLPFLWHLLSETSVKDQVSPSIDWIYTYFRNPHHTAPFASLNFFLHKYLKGVITSVAASIYLFWTLKTERTSKNVKFFVEAALLANILVFVGLAISFFDHEGVILKFYVFRLSAISKFLTCMTLGYHAHKLIKYYAANRSSYSLIMACSLFICVCIGSYRFVKHSETLDIRNFAKAVNQYVPSVAQILNLSENGSSVDGKWDALPRLSERDWYVSYKFVPAGGVKVREWYERVQRVKKLSLSPSEISVDEFPYILARRGTVLSNHRPLFEDHGFILFGPAI